jgi:hypothetical protein
MKLGKLFAFAISVLFVMSTLTFAQSTSGT